MPICFNRPDYQQVLQRLLKGKVREGTEHISNSYFKYDNDKMKEVRTTSSLKGE
jgi:hypothetical protein